MGNYINCYLKTQSRQRQDVKTRNGDLHDYQIDKKGGYAAWMIYLENW